MEAPYFRVKRRAKEEQVRSVAGRHSVKRAAPLLALGERVKGSIRYGRNSGHRIFIGLPLYLSHVGSSVDLYYLDRSYPLGDTVWLAGWCRDNLQMLYKCYGIRFALTARDIGGTMMGNKSRLNVPRCKKSSKSIFHVWGI